jgi:hypothetical protein
MFECRAYSTVSIPELEEGQLKLKEFGKKLVKMTSIQSDMATLESVHCLPDPAYAYHMRLK